MRAAYGVIPIERSADSGTTQLMAPVSTRNVPSQARFRFSGVHHSGLHIGCAHWRLLQELRQLRDRFRTRSDSQHRIRPSRRLRDFQPTDYNPGRTVMPS